MPMLRVQFPVNSWYIYHKSSNLHFLSQIYSMMQVNVKILILFFSANIVRKRSWTSPSCRVTCNADIQRSLTSVSSKRALNRFTTQCLFCIMFHLNVPCISELMTDNKKKIQTIKLQDEINKLQEQLTLVTFQMETQQKDYTAKQVRKSRY